MRVPKTLIPVLAGLLAIGLLAAGCGGDDSEETSVPGLEGVSQEDLQQAAEEAEQALEGVSDEELDQAADEAQEALEDPDVQGAVDDAIAECESQAETLPEEERDAAIQLCNAAAGAVDSGG